MTENKRFDIKPSSIVDDCFVIIDSESKYAFPTLESTLNYMFCKALNELNDENQKLKDKLCELGVSDVKGIDTGLEDWLND